jgi:hypothetical protein
MIIPNAVSYIVEATLSAGRQALTRKRVANRRTGITTRHDVKNYETAVD